MSRQLGAQRIAQLFARLSELNPTPTTELRYTTDFQLLAAVMLSAQTTDKAVNKCTPALFAAAPDAAAMAQLGADGIAPYIRSIGLYSTKAKHLACTAQCLVQYYAGGLPRTRKQLEALPGVGRKTANVVLNTAFGEHTIAVDTHVFRVANRTGLAPGATVTRVEQGLLRRVPKTYMRHAHHWLILLGRYTCIARAPRCTQCPIMAQCNYQAKSSSLQS